MMLYPFDAMPGKCHKKVVKSSEIAFLHFLGDFPGFETRIPQEAPTEPNQVMGFYTDFCMKSMYI